MAKMLKVERVGEVTARRIADIMGPSSAHARALEELDRRRNAGEDLVLVRPDRSSLLIIARADLKDEIGVETAWSEHA